MYCMNCGRENPEGVKFCCFCGTSANSVPRSVVEKSDKIPENPAENGQIDIDENEAPDSLTAISEVNFGKTEAASKINVPPVVPTAPTSSTAPVSPTAPISATSPLPSPNFASPQNPYAYPQPLPINTQGVSYAPRAGQNAQNVNIPMKNTVSEEKQDFERKYTIKHIIMCLASTAVCAIAAGIFAGLYFSVV